MGSARLCSRFVQWCVVEPESPSSVQVISLPRDPVKERFQRTSRNVKERLKVRIDERRVEEEEHRELRKKKSGRRSGNNNEMITRKSGRATFFGRQTAGRLVNPRDLKDMFQLRYWVWIQYFPEAWLWISRIAWEREKESAMLFADDLEELAAEVFAGKGQGRKWSTLSIGTVHSLFRFASTTQTNGDEMTSTSTVQLHLF